MILNKKHRDFVTFKLIQGNTLFLNISSKSTKKTHTHMDLKLFKNERHQCNSEKNTEKCVKQVKKGRKRKRA
jgi:hypothetical protein